MRLPIRVLQPISIRRESDPEDKWYPSVVLDFVEEQELIVSPPMEQGEEVEIQVGSTIEVEAFLPDGIRRFHTVVRRRDPDPMKQLRLDWPEEATRIQRRDAVRVRVGMKVEVLPGATPGKPIVGLSEDLSEGGMRLDLPGLPVGTALQLSFDLPGIGVRKAKGSLLRWGEIEVPKGEPRYWLAVQFTEVTDAVRKDITRAIFDIQREQLRRG